MHNTTTTCAQCGVAGNNIDGEALCAPCFASVWAYAAPDPQTAEQRVVYDNMYAALEAYEIAVVELDDAIADLRSSHATTKGATT